MEHKMENNKVILNLRVLEKNAMICHRLAREALIHKISMMDNRECEHSKTDYIRDCKHDATAIIAAAVVLEQSLSNLWYIMEACDRGAVEIELEVKSG